MNDLFFYVEEAGICNFGNGNTLHSWGKLLLPIVKQNLTRYDNILPWFKLNSTKTNAGKFQFMF